MPRSAFCSSGAQCLVREAARSGNCCPLVGTSNTVSTQSSQQLEGAGRNSGVIPVSQMRRSNSQCLSDLPNYSTAGLLKGQPYPKYDASNIAMETEPRDSCPGFLKVHTCSKSKVPENVGKGASATVMRLTPTVGEVRMRHRSATRYVRSGAVRTRRRSAAPRRRGGGGP